jgi:hypothetical protein
MKAVATALTSLVVLAVAVAARTGAAQQNGGQDPRIGLAPGFRNAGVAARNVELMASVPKPPGFFDPAAPSGVSMGPDKDDEEDAKKDKPADKPATPPPPFTGLDFVNSDLGFSGTRLFAGNFSGINIYDIKDPKRPSLITSLLCPGGQGDVSIHGNLLFMSVEQSRGRVDCGTTGVAQTVSSERFRGVRIFDISDIRSPRQIAAVQTCRGSHTHTLLVDPKDSANVYIYGSGTANVRSASELEGCLDAKEDPNTALFSIDVIKVPLAAPDKAAIVNRPRIFGDSGTGSISALWPGGTHGPGTQKTSATDQCHDITVFPDVGLAAGACSGNGILLDITDPVNPTRIDQVEDKNFAYWHSATFNNDGTKVIFTDEWGGGTRPRCRQTDPPTWGANAIFDIVDRKLRFASYYKLPAAQSEIENCVAHNGSLVPVPGRDIMVQGWYQGGVSVFDFTDSKNPVEIAFFDRGPVDAKHLITAGHWSAYWYNGAIYASEMARGLDVLRLRPSEYLTQNELQAASQVTWAVLNTQHQQKVAWPATIPVARAYFDQLTRAKALSTERAAEVKSALDRGNRDKEALHSLASKLEVDATSADATTALRLRGLANALARMGP